MATTNNETGNDTTDDSGPSTAPATGITIVPTTKPTQAPTEEPLQTVFKASTYKVGTDIPAGEYKLISTDDAIGYGYFEVDSDSSHQLESIVTNENFEGSTYVTVSEGQYLKISSAKISQ